MTRLRATAAFTAVVIRSMVRDRTALFFVLVLPVLVIVIIGTTFGGAERLEIGVAPAEAGLGDQVVDALEAADGLAVQRFAGEGSVRDAVLRRDVVAGVVVPVGFDAAVRRGEPATVLLLVGPEDQSTFTAQITVDAVVDDVAARLGAATFAARHAGIDFDQALPLADAAAATGGIEVVVDDVGGGDVQDLSTFSVVAPQNLVLFVFINAMASAGFLVRARKDGVLRRSLATPTSTSTVLTGLGLGWFVFALLQSLLIVLVGRIAFGVHWGNPPAALALVVIWALVGCGAGLLVGAFGEDEDRVGAITPPVGVVLGALGGCMVPLEIFPPAMQAISRAVPHSWAVSGWSALVLDGGTITDIAGSLAVLTAWAVALVAAASVLMHRRLVRP
jgi:ABC-2 type transport system permease protein